MSQGNLYVPPNWITKNKERKYIHEHIVGKSRVQSMSAQTYNIPYLTPQTPANPIQPTYIPSSSSIPIPKTQHPTSLLYSTHFKSPFPTSPPPSPTIHQPQSLLNPQNPISTTQTQKKREKKRKENREK